MKINEKLTYFSVITSQQHWLSYNYIVNCKWKKKGSVTVGKEELEKTTNLTITHISKTGKYKDKIIDKEYEYLDISPLNVSKGTALEVLSQYLELNKEDILSVGDNINDIDMFRASGIGAAVNNAYDEVKQVASYVTTNSAENAGFAEAIYKFVPFQF